MLKSRTQVCSSSEALVTWKAETCERLKMSLHCRTSPDSFCVLSVSPCIAIGEFNGFKGSSCPSWLICCGVWPKSQYFQWGWYSSAWWKIRLKSTSANGIKMFFFHFYLSGRKVDFFPCLPEPWKCWQPFMQSPGTKLTKSVPRACPTHQLCREAHALHHHPGQEQSLVLDWFIAFQPNKDQQERKDQCSWLCLCCKFYFLFDLFLLCWCLHNFVQPLLLFFCTLTFRSSSFFALCSTISWWWLKSSPFVLSLVLLYPTPRRAIKFLLT